MWLAPATAGGSLEQLVGASLLAHLRICRTTHHGSANRSQVYLALKCRHQDLYQLTTFGCSPASCELRDRLIDATSFFRGAAVSFKDLQVSTSGDDVRRMRGVLKNASDQFWNQSRFVLAIAVDGHEHVVVMLHGEIERGLQGRSITPIR